MNITEAQFAKILEDIKYEARVRGGFIPKEEVYNFFGNMELTDEQFGLVFEYLKANKIGVDTPLEDAEVQSEETISILEEYKSELAELELMNDGQLKATIMAAMNNDVSAQTALISQYLPKVIEIAKLYTDQGVSIEDLIGEGNLAIAEGVTMLGALEEPEEADGMLVKLIMDAMEECISENFEETKKDEKIATKVNKVADAARKLSEELGRKVSVDELVENTSLSKKAVLDAIELSGKKIEDIE